MKYKQSVILKNVSIESARIAFSEISFLKHLIAFQPVKIIEWEGTFDGAIAHMRFWFFGWKDFKVKHSDNFKDVNSFSFKDQGLDLPFGLNQWVHEHIVIKRGKNIEIIDEIIFSGNNKFLAIIVYPILIAPIFFRKVLYQTYSWK